MPFVYILFPFLALKKSTYYNFCNNYTRTTYFCFGGFGVGSESGVGGWGVSSGGWRGGWGINVRCLTAH